MYFGKQRKELKAPQSLIYFKLFLKAQTIENVWENSWSLSEYQKRQYAKQKRNGKEPFKTEGKTIEKLQ